VLEIRQDDGTWETYTGEDHLGCGTNLAMSLVDQPIMSAELLSRLRGGHLLENEADHFVVVHMDIDNEYHFRIDKETWEIRSLEVRGLDWYAATYYYGEHEGMHYLRMIAIDGDTTLGKGGYRFHNVYLNGEPVPATLTAVRRPVARFGPASDRRVGLSGSAVLFDPRGRAVGGAGNLPGGRHTGVSHSGRRGAPGASGTYFLLNDVDARQITGIVWGRR